MPTCLCVANMDSHVYIASFHVSGTPTHVLTSDPSDEEPGGSGSRTNMEVANFDSKAAYMFVGRRVEPLTPISRLLGREHIITKSADMTWIEYCMSDFAESTGETYLEFSGGQCLEHAATPSLVHTALPESDWDPKGSLSEHAAKIPYAMPLAGEAQSARPAVPDYRDESSNHEMVNQRQLKLVPYVL